jgi:hypothetical protein
MKTTFGEVPLWGRLEAGKPLLFVIRGAFPQRDHLRELVELLPDYSVGLVHVPGMHSPFFADQSVAAFGQAFDEIVDAFGGPTVVLGVSIGGVCAMAMRSRHIAHRVLLGAPLQTGGLWQLTERLRDRIGLSPEHAAWIESLFGVTPTEVVNRDYRALVRPSDIVILCSDPLGEPRDYDRPPSVVPDEDRAAYRAAGARVIVAPDSGHDLVRDAYGLVLATVEEAMRSAMPAPG